MQLVAASSIGRLYVMKFETAMAGIVVEFVRGQNCTRSSNGSKNSCSQCGDGHYGCQYFAKYETVTGLRACPKSSAVNCAADHLRWERMHSATDDHVQDHLRQDNTCMQSLPIFTTADTLTTRNDAIDVYFTIVCVLIIEVVNVF